MTGFRRVRYVLLLPAIVLIQACIATNGDYMPEKIASAPGTGTAGLPADSDFAARANPGIASAGNATRNNASRDNKSHITTSRGSASQASAGRASAGRASAGRASAGRASAGQKSSADRLLGLMDQAESAYRAEHWERASIVYQQVLSEVPDNPYIWFRLGNALTQQGLYSQAILAFETSLQSDSRQVKPWFNLSTAHLLGAHVATLRAYDTLAQGDPARSTIEQRLNALKVLLQ